MEQIVPIPLGLTRNYAFLDEVGTLYRRNDQLLNTCIFGSARTYVYIDAELTRKPRTRQSTIVNF